MSCVTMTAAAVQELSGLLMQLWLLTFAFVIAPSAFRWSSWQLRRIRRHQRLRRRMRGYQRA